METKFENVYIECLEEIRHELQSIKANIHIYRFLFYLLLKQSNNPQELLGEFLEKRDNFLGQIKAVDTHVLARHYEDYEKLVQEWVDAIQENQEQKEPHRGP